MTRRRMAAVVTAAVLMLAALTGCPVQAESDGDDDEGGDDHIHYALTR